MQVPDDGKGNDRNKIASRACSASFDTPLREKFEGEWRLL